MTTFADSLVSSSARSLAVRKRRDLTAYRQQYEGRVYWVVKDPLALLYSRFGEEEYAILEMLDGTISLDVLKQRFSQRFAPQQISIEELHRFVGSLHQRGLVFSDSPGQGPELYRRHRTQKRQKLFSAFTNILSIRFRGIDPERILSWLHTRTRWFFSPWCVTLCLLLAAAAALLVTVHFDTFRLKLPGFQNFFTLQNVLWLSVVMGVTKVIHEFGHGLTCKHFGGECHEMGLLLLVLTPCLYCNVSDSWVLPNKWHRAAIGAAGMYVEVVMASVATFVWWTSQPGLLHHLALDVMLVCSVSTLLFNGNPLLRYDGYYILSDLLEIPNLRQKASQILSEQLGSLCLGLEKSRDAFLPKQRQWLFALYSVAASCYQWFVLFSILWFLNKFFEPYRLDAIGQVLTLVSIGGLVGMPAWKLFRYFSVPGRIAKVKFVRLAATFLILAGIVSLILWFPVPHHIHTTLTVEPRDAQPVYVVVPGKLDEVYVKSGERVTPGQRLATLSNDEIRLATAELTSQRDQQAVRIEILRQQRFTDPKAGAEIPQAQESLDSLNERLANRQRDAERLSLIVPAEGGIILPAPVRQEKTPEDTLGSWSGTPLDPKNAGSFLDTGTLFCLVGDPARLEAILVIDQADVEFIHTEQTVEIQLEQSSGTIHHGQIVELARQDLQAAPRQLSGKAGGRLATQTDDRGVERPLNTSYQARVPLADPAGLLRPGLRGRAKVTVAPQTWGQWIWRQVSQTFHFKL